MRLQRWPERLTVLKAIVRPVRLKTHRIAMVAELGHGQPERTARLLNLSASFARRWALSQTAASRSS